VSGTVTGIEYVGLCPLQILDTMLRCGVAEKTMQARHNDPSIYFCSDLRRPRPVVQKRRHSWCSYLVREKPIPTVFLFDKTGRWNII